MKSKGIGAICSLLIVAGMVSAIAPMHAADAAAKAAVPVRMTVTANVASNKRMPDINQDDIKVNRGKDRLEVTEWVAARGENAGLDLFILIDDSVDPRVGGQFDDLRAFIASQPATTSIGVGYMRNASVLMVQDLSMDHSLAAAAIRLPLGHSGAYGSPYLSAISLMKSWPEDGRRHEIVMITDGVDRARRHFSFHRGLTTYPDADTAISVAQKTGTIIHSLYAPGTGGLHGQYWRATNGQMNMARLSDSTGGESYYLGLHSPVSFKPYLDSLQQVLDNQYLLSFSAKPGKRAGLQAVSLSTEVAGVELSAHDAVWVPAGN